MRRFGLIGFPLSHSFSPAYFAKKFQSEGYKDCIYEAFPIKSIDEFSSLLSDNPDIEGLNVTIPYKKDVVRFLHTSTEAVKQIGACNCIKIHKGVLSGYNTDVLGFEKSLVSKLADGHKKALVLGTGGSAAAVEFVLRKLGIVYLSVSRNKKQSKSSVTYQELSNKVLNEHTLIINTTPLGMYPDIDQCPDIPYQYLTSDHYLYDLVYNPVETMFLRKGAAKGALTKNGSDMLVIQAEESWKIWNEVGGGIR